MRYKQHSALDNLLKTYKLKEAVVLGDCNVLQEQEITYLPVYMLMFLKPYRLPEKLIYSIDLSELDKHIK